MQPGTGSSPGRGHPTLFASSWPRRVPASRHTAHIEAGRRGALQHLGGPLGSLPTRKPEWRGMLHGEPVTRVQQSRGPSPSIAGQACGWRARQLCRGRTGRVSGEASAARPRSRAAASGIATSAGELPMQTSGAARATARAARHRRNQRQMRTRAMAARSLRCSHLSSNRRCFAQRRLSSRRRGAGAATRRRPPSVTMRPLVLANEANSMPATRPELKPARRSSLTTWRSPARASALRPSSASSRASRCATATATDVITFRPCVSSLGQIMTIIDY